MNIAKVLWISHRGNHVQSVENTKQAFKLAVAQGYRHIETDLRISSDGQIVHWHDPSVKDQKGAVREIGKLPRRELEQIRLPFGEKLLFFDEFASEFSGLGWTLDIKIESGVEVLKTLHKLDGQTHWSKAVPDLRFLLWSKAHLPFAKAIQDPLHRYADKNECIRAGLAALANLPELGRIESSLVYSLPNKFLGFHLFQPRIIGAFHNFGARVIAYLPTTQDEVKAAIDSGIDEILSDFPKPF